MLHPIPHCLCDEKLEEWELIDTPYAYERHIHPVAIPITIQPGRHPPPCLPSSYSTTSDELSESLERRMQDIAFPPVGSVDSGGLSQSYKSLMPNTTPERIPIKWGLGNQALFGIGDSDEEEDFIEPGRTWLSKKSEKDWSDRDREEDRLLGQGARHDRRSIDLRDLLDEDCNGDIGVSRPTLVGAGVGKVRKDSLGLMVNPKGTQIDRTIRPSLYLVDLVDDKNLKRSKTSKNIVEQDIARTDSDADLNVEILYQ